jgi:probable addiction module antidote protein
MSEKLKKVSNYESFDNWVADLIQQEPNGIDNFIQTAFEEFIKDGNEKALLIALGQVAKAKGGFRELAEKTGIKRESLYRALSEHGNPRLNTFLLVINALGYGLALKKFIHRK